MTTCKAVAEIRAEEREISNNRIYSLVEKGYLTPEHAAEALEITIEQLQEDMESLRGRKTVMDDGSRPTLLTQEDFYRMDRETYGYYRYIVGYAKAGLRYLSFDDTLKIIKSEFDLDDYTTQTLAKEAQEKLEAESGKNEHDERQNDEIYS